MSNNIFQGTYVGLQYKNMQVHTDRQADTCQQSQADAGIFPETREEFVENNKDLSSEYST